LSILSYSAIQRACFGGKYTIRLCSMNTVALPLLGARSWYSLMDGARSPSDFAAAAGVLSWSALALADQNNMYALP
jgi:hypothetical protein